MPAPIFLDLRRRIVRAVERGSSIGQAARRFALSPAAALKLMPRVRASGRAAPRARRRAAALRGAGRARDDPQRAPPELPAV